jgi:hypothetical protein
MSQSKWDVEEEEEDMAGGAGPSSRVQHGEMTRRWSALGLREVSANPVVDL